jgi:hypothetical protein
MDIQILAATEGFVRGCYIIVDGRWTGTGISGDASARESIDRWILSAEAMLTTVATTDTRMMPSRPSSKVAPTIMLASASTHLVKGEVLAAGVADEKTTFIETSR